MGALPVARRSFFCAAVVLGFVLPATSWATAVSFSCLSAEAAVGRVSTAFFWDRQTGCPGPLVANTSPAPPQLTPYTGTATVDTSAGRIEGSVSYTPGNEPSPDAYFLSLAAVSLTLTEESPDLHIVPAISGDSAAAWNLLLRILDEHGLVAEYFIGDPIFPSEGAYLADPAVADVTIPLEPGHAYTLISQLELGVSGGEGLSAYSKAISVDLVAVPEPRAGVALCGGLASLAVAGMNRRAGRGRAAGASG
jgi:hypothetical protein